MRKEPSNATLQARGDATGGRSGGQRARGWGAEARRDAQEGGGGGGARARRACAAPGGGALVNLTFFLI